ncbi:hypothetical protein IV203_025614 [Nitzschia inconspicua]|uniref:Uncharacterized protein n=1 Tax=Nitzschia inconspicua TaxID=303405 RepID=A0A9K3PW76_9STRA|nr:hypothetical protein IV203_033424 [Nitzschia inconspicua]KAG7361948.1 hypothetical protein IV203_025614 [Nitzschia inconspicua]
MWHLFVLLALSLVWPTSCPSSVRMDSVSLLLLYASPYHNPSQHPLSAAALSWELSCGLAPPTVPSWHPVLSQARRSYQAIRDLFSLIYLSWEFHFDVDDPHILFHKPFDTFHQVQEKTHHNSILTFISNMLIKLNTSVFRLFKNLFDPVILDTSISIPLSRNHYRQVGLVTFSSAQPPSEVEHLSNVNISTHLDTLSSLFV